MKSIDLEHHFFSKAFYDYVKDRTEPPFFKNGYLVHRPGAAFPVYDKPDYNPPYTLLEEETNLDTTRIAVMDACNITQGVISSINGFEELPREDCVRIARATNDEIAAAVKAHPDRFYGTFCLPSPYIKESLEELDRAVNVLGLKYWHTHSSYGESALYQEQFEPIFAKLTEYDIPFYVHPSYPTDSYLLDSGIAFSGAGFGFGVDTMKTTIRLFMSGIFDRYPNLTMILGHMGEFYPYIIERMDNRFEDVRDADEGINNMEHSFEYYFKNGNVFMTTSGISDPDVAVFAIKKFGADRVLMGTDYPLEDTKKSREFIDSLPISNQDKEKILYKNAERYILKDTASRS